MKAPPAPSTPIPLEAILNRAWVLFRRNWIVAVPPAAMDGRPAAERR